MNNSRFITYPSVVDLNSNHKVILIDATPEELVHLERFLQTSITNFDVYLYEGNIGDLEWLNYVSYDAALTLINDSSQVKITPNSTRYQDNLLEHFEHIELDLAD